MNVGEVLGVAMEGKNYSVVHAGEFSALDQFETKSPGKVFLKNSLGLTGMEVSLNKIGPGQSAPFAHQHKNNEELYICIKGSGQFQVDGDVIDLREGTVVRVAPGGTRAWRNNSEEDLYMIVIQAPQGSLQTWSGSDGIIVEGGVSWPGA